MNTVSRNPTVHLGNHEEKPMSSRGHSHGWRMFSTRRNNQNLSQMMSSLSYRQRARKRLIFLRSYNLGSVSSRLHGGDDDKLLKSRKLKKLAAKVKSAAVSVLSFMRGGALRSCDSRSAIDASSPARVTKFC